MGGVESHHQPVALKGNQTGLTIEWDDGAVHTITWRQLRDACPCATCRTQPAQPDNSTEDDLLPVITPEEAQPLKATAMRPIGNYAYGIEFTDGHNSGIYSLEWLRQLGEVIEDARRGA